MKRWLLAWIAAAMVATLTALLGFSISALAAIVVGVHRAVPWWASVVQGLVLYLMGLPIALLLAGAAAGVRAMLRVRGDVTMAEAVVIGAAIGAAMNAAVAIAIFAGWFTLFGLPVCIPAGAVGGATFAALLRQSRARAPA